MTSKEYLHSVRSLDFRIERLRESLEEIRARASVQSPQLDRVGHSSEISRKPEIYAVQLERIQDQIYELLSEKVTAVLLIQEIEDNILAAVLTSYYINRRTWEETAVRLGYSEVHVMRSLKPKALAAFEIVYQAAGRG